MRIIREFTSYLPFSEHVTSRRDCDTRVINELRPYLNESDLEYIMTTKDLKELKVTIYINKVHLPF